jgi:renalase
LGGRMATRRLHNTIADHGAKFLEVQGVHTQELITNLMARGIVESWRGMKDCYTAPLGMSAIAKNMATNLDIRLNHKVAKINPTDQGWSIFFDKPDLAPLSRLEAEGSSFTQASIEAKALIIAIPAPQALALLSPLGSLDENSLDANYLTQLAGVEYDACITVMAGYEPDFQQILDIQTPTWPAVTFAEDAILAWVGIDSSKRSQSPQPVVVLHSTPSFAAEHLESLDINSLGQELLNIASTHLLPELNSPQWFQVHRWRYAQPKTFLNAPCFPAPTTSPLVCCGDWCQDISSNNSTPNLTSNFIENALVSGLAAAQYLKFAH